MRVQQAMTSSRIMHTTRVDRGDWGCPVQVQKSSMGSTVLLFLPYSWLLREIPEYQIGRGGDGQYLGFYFILAYFWANKLACLLAKDVCLFFRGMGLQYSQYGKQQHDHQHVSISASCHLPPPSPVRVTRRAQMDISQGSGMQWVGL